MTNENQTPSLTFEDAAVSVEDGPTMQPAAFTAETIEAGPQLTPPEEVTAGETAEGITAWLNNTKIVGLWSNGSNKNSWISIQAVGWRRLHPGNESAVVAMTLLASHAKVDGRNVNVRLGTDNTVHEIYVW